MNKKNIYDKESMLKDISERKKLIEEYKAKGYLNREDAIKKIIELRSSDPDVSKVTTERLIVSSIPFDKATDEAIATELQMQIDILSLKISKCN